MNISSSNYYSVSASSNKGFSGLVSGMDTEGMVKEMLSGTQKKIDQQKQAKQVVEWKQDIYHDVISTINNFQSSYFDKSFDASSENNLIKASFFNSMKSSVKSGGSVNIISSSSSALTGDMKIKVSKLASAARLESSSSVSGKKEIDGTKYSCIEGTSFGYKEFTDQLNENGVIQFDMTLDGVTKNISIEKSEFKDVKEANFGDAIQNVVESKVKKAFGSYIGVSMEKKVASGEGSDTYKFDFYVNIKSSDGPIENGHELKITGADSKYIGVEPGSSSIINGMSKISELPGISAGVDTFDFTINDTQISIDKDATVSNLINTINSSNAGVKIAYSSMTDKFSMEATSTGEQYGIEISEQKSGNILSTIFGVDFSTTPTEIGKKEDGKEAIGTAGTDAEITVNGVKTSRTSNTFTIDGITMTATKESEVENVIGTVRDDEKVIDAIKSFVDDYNKMLTKLDGYVTEEAEYRDYPPLTEEQKKEMSDKEITLWEEKAKTGIVRSDDDINAFLDQARSIAYATPKNAGIGLYSIGITTKNFEPIGKLYIDESKLRSALASDPESIVSLFTDPVDGIATQLNETCDSAAKVSLASPGRLVTKAGADNWDSGEKNNDLYRELNTIKDNLEDLQRRYETEKSRYWSQFTEMETVLSQYNSQSNMLAQQFMSY